MNFTHSFVFLLAETRSFPKMGEQARPDAQLITPEFYVLFGAVVAIIALVAAVKKYNRWRERRDRNYPWGVFQELCRAHGLSRGERRVLARVARTHGLTHPGVLFVDPTTLAGEPSAAAERLRVKLFGA